MSLLKKKLRSKSSETYAKMLATSEGGRVEVCLYILIWDRAHFTKVYSGDKLSA